MGKLALTPERIMERIYSFNQQDFNLKIYLVLTEKYIYVNDSSDNTTLMYCKPQYIEDLLTALHLMKQCGFYCKFYAKGVTKTSYYKKLAKNNLPYKRFELWKNLTNCNLL